MCNAAQPMNMVKTKGTLRTFCCNVKHQLPSAGTWEVVLKDLLERNLSWPKHSMKIAELFKKKQDQNTRESEKQGGFTAKMRQNKLRSRGIISS